MIELEKCPQCDSPVSRKVDGEVHFCCDSWITPFGAFIAKDFCNGRTQAIAETEARIAEELLKMPVTYTTISSGGKVTRKNYVMRSDLLPIIQRLSTGRTAPTQSDSVNDGRGKGETHTLVIKT